MVPVGGAVQVLLVRRHDCSQKPPSSREMLGSFVLGSRPRRGRKTCFKIHRPRSSYSTGFGRGDSHTQVIAWRTSILMIWRGSPPPRDRARKETEGRMAIRPAPQEAVTTGLFLHAPRMRFVHRGLRRQKTMLSLTYERQPRATAETSSTRAPCEVFVAIILGKDACLIVNPGPKLPWCRG